MTLSRLCTCVPVLCTKKHLQNDRYGFSLLFCIPEDEINVDDDQVSDRIDEAFQFFREHHHDAIIKIYKKQYWI